jgi:hypothetical protein
MSRARANADATSQVYIENNASTQDLSGTYSTERLYFNDSYQLTGDVTVTGHLALGSIADEDVVITQDSTERTITGSGTLEAGNVLQDTHRTDLTDMTGTLANSVQDNVTRLGTVTAANLSNTAIVYPDGHIINTYYFAYTTAQTLTVGGSVGTVGVFTEYKTVNVPAGCSITCIVDGGRSHWGASYGTNHGLQINGTNYENLHNMTNTFNYFPASMVKSVYISGGAANCNIKYIVTRRGSYNGESYLGGTYNTAHMVVFIHQGDIT